MLRHAVLRALALMGAAGVLLAALTDQYSAKARPRRHPQRATRRGRQSSTMPKRRTPPCGRSSIGMRI